MWTLRGAQGKEDVHQAVCVCASLHLVIHLLHREGEREAQRFVQGYTAQSVEQGFESMCV